MSNPKFQIGEEVYVIDGEVEYEFIITDMFYSDSDEGYWSGWWYDFGVGNMAKEFQLRKKHKPADDDFQEWLRSVINTEKNGSVLTTLKVRNKKNKTMMGEME